MLQRKYDVPFFIYSLSHPISKRVRYIGASRQPQERLRQHIGSSGYYGKSLWMDSLKKKNLHPTLKILEEVQGCIEAIIAECKWTLYYAYSGSNLFNYNIGEQWIAFALKDKKLRTMLIQTGAIKKNVQYPKTPILDNLIKSNEDTFAIKRFIDRLRTRKCNGLKEDYVTTIANKLNIDLEKAKEEKRTILKFRKSIGLGEFYKNRLYRIHWN